MAQRQLDCDVSGLLDTVKVEYPSVDRLAAITKKLTLTRFSVDKQVISRKKEEALPWRFQEVEISL